MTTPLEYEKKDGKVQYGDYLEVEGKPDGLTLRECVAVLTEQMLDVLDSIKVELHGNPVTWVIKEHIDKAGFWTIGWKILV